MIEPAQLVPRMRSAKPTLLPVRLAGAEPFLFGLFRVCSLYPCEVFEACAALAGSVANNVVSDASSFSISAVRRFDAVFGRGDALA